MIKNKMVVTQVIDYFQKSKYILHIWWNI